MTTKSRHSIYGASVRAAAERAKEARKEAIARVWSLEQRMLGGFKGTCAAVACIPFPKRSMVLT
jgi:hypothetical protein